MPYSNSDVPTLEDFRISVQDEDNPFHDAVYYGTFEHNGEVLYLFTQLDEDGDKWYLAAWGWPQMGHYYADRFEFGGWRFGEERFYTTEIKKREPIEL